MFSTPMFAWSYICWQNSIFLTNPISSLWEHCWSKQVQLEGKFVQWKVLHCQKCTCGSWGSRASKLDVEVDNVGPFNGMHGNNIWQITFCQATFFGDWFWSKFAVSTLDGSPFDSSSILDSENSTKLLAHFLIHDVNLSEWITWESAFGFLSFRKIFSVHATKMKQLSPMNYSVLRNDESG